ncbi:MAG: hypothetical protein QXK78_02630 [Candidatus Bathyarchaeia archaeon]
MESDQLGVFDKEVIQLRDTLISLAAEIAAKYSSSVSSKKVIDLLMENLCERCIIERLKVGYSGDEEIDRVWRNLHEYAVSLLVERLKNELAAKGFPISIFSEADNPTGRYDVLLIADRRSIQILNSCGNICIEAKTGLNISLSQSEKYMWNGTTIVLVRFASGDTIVLRAAEWADFLRAALADRIEKAKRILDGKVILVPGRDCYECPAEQCRFKKNCGREREPTKPRSMEELFDGFRRNAYNAIDEAVRAVMVELSRILEGETNQL